MEKVFKFAAQLQVVFEATDADTARKWAHEQAQKLGDDKKHSGLVSIVQVINVKKPQLKLVAIDSDPMWSGN